MDPQELEAIVSAPLATRMRWYAELNTWRVPADFPIPMPVFTDTREQHRDPRWRAAWDAVAHSLSESDQSLGWFRHEMKQTDEEWLAWWGKKFIAKTTIAEIERAKQA